MGKYSLVVLRGANLGPEDNSSLIRGKRLVEDLGDVGAARAAGPCRRAGRSTDFVAPRAAADWTDRSGLTPDQSLFVSSFNSDQVMRYHADGTPYGIAGQRGGVCCLPAQRADTRRSARRPDGRLYVVSSTNQVFRYDGETAPLSTSS